MMNSKSIDMEIVMIYLDHAATTSVHPYALRAMIPYMDEKYGNPSGVYEFATHNRKSVEQVRELIAETIHSHANEIYFTSGGTESDNMALFGVASAMKRKGRHIITSRIEHHAVLYTCEQLERLGYDVTYLDVDENGFISLEQLQNAIRTDTILISIMAANNEIGTIEPIGRIGEIAHSRDVYFHTDAVQAYMHIPINVEDMNIDILSASGHKFRGPKGVGFIYIRDGVDVGKFMYGGGQERNMRAGTENVPGIIGMGEAVAVAHKSINANMVYLRNMREYLLYRLGHEMSGVRLNGSRERRLPGNLNISFEGIEGEALIIMLDMDGICASAGSACTAGLGGASHVLEAVNVPDKYIKGTLRLTLGTDNNMSDMDYTVESIKKIVNILREE